MESPKIQPIFAPSSIKSGESLKVFCTFEKGSQPVQFLWSINGKEIISGTSSGQRSIETFSGHSVLTLNSVGLTDGGNRSRLDLTCTVVNSIGKDSSSAEIIIQGLWFDVTKFDIFLSIGKINSFNLISDSPKWKSEPMDVVAIKNKPVKLFCDAIGNPIPDIKWNKNGRTNTIKIKLHF